MNCKLNLGYCLVIGLLVIGICLPALAMGSAPKKEEPKYKLEILKMELVPTMTATLELNIEHSAVFILPARNVRDSELSQLKEGLTAKGVKVSLASEKDTALSQKGKKLKMDLLTKDVKASEFSAMVFIGDDRAVVGSRILTRQAGDSYKKFAKEIIKTLGL